MQKKLSKILLIISLIFIFLVPLFLLYLLSISSNWSWPELFPGNFGIKSWLNVFNQTQVKASIWTTIWIGVLVILLNLILALPAAKALAHYDFKGKNLIDTIYLLPILIPSMGIAMGLHFTMIKYGLADSWVGVILIHLVPTLPYSIRIFRTAFEDLGVKWEEQARCLGASEMTVFRTIWLPLILPSIRAVIFLTFIISMSQYLLTVIIGGGKVVTLALVYFPFFNSSNPGAIAVLSIIFALLPLFIMGILELFIRMLFPINKLTP